MSTLRIVVVGYCPPTEFNEHDAKEMLADAFNAVLADHPDATDIWVVSGLTDVGVPALAYRAAVARGWKTSGIACVRANEHPCFDVDERIVDEELWLNWGDESETFLAAINVIVRLGGGNQSLAEVAIFKSRGGRAYEYELEAIAS